MRIAMNFTIDVPQSSLAALYEVAEVEPGDQAGARLFVQAEAEQYLVDYLRDNGVRLVPVRGVALTNYPGELQ